MSQPKAADCPHNEILDLCAAVLPEIPKPLRQGWTTRKGGRDLLARWKESEKHRNLEFWRWFFGIVRENPFYIGVGSRIHADGKPWKATPAWLFEKENFYGMIERGLNNGR